VVAARSYLSQSDPAVTFGLGDAISVDAAAVVWPDGERQELDPSAWSADSTQVITRGGS
jgi:hypothetical protein